VPHSLTDFPVQGDAIVVVAGARDGQSVYARHLAEYGLTGRIFCPGRASLLGDPPPLSTPAAPPRPASHSMGGAPNSSAALYVDTTEVEPTSANRIAHSRGWKSLLVVAGVRVTASVLRTRPQGGQQVGDLVVTVVILGLLALGDRERLSPGRLGLDELLELILVVVLTLLGSKSTAIVSISEAAILTSCGRTFASLSSPSRIAGRISSGHKSVCSMRMSL